MTQNIVLVSQTAEKSVSVHQSYNRIDIATEEATQKGFLLRKE